jgi:hypothetical protein
MNFIDSNIYGYPYGLRLGICGLIAAHFAKLSVLTDHNDIVLELLQRNVDHWNEIDSSRNCTCKHLNWGETLDEFVAVYPHGFDVLLGSDIV